MTQSGLASGRVASARCVQAVSRSATILVVASDPDVRTLITHMLARSGFDALGAADEADALAVAGGADIDLLVIEVAPSFDGRSIVDHLGGQDHGVPVVYVSAWFDHQWFVAPEAAMTP